MSKETIEKIEKSVVLSETEKATKALTSVLAGIAKATDTLPEFQAELEAVTEKVAIKNNELVDLEQAVAVQSRENKIELDLKVRENEDAVLEEILDSRNLVTIDEDEKSALETAAERNEEEVYSAVKKAEGALSGKLNSEHQNSMEKLELEFKVQESDNKSKINELTNQITFLKNQLEASEKRASDKLDAEIKIAEAGSGITVNTVGK